MLLHIYQHFITYHVNLQKATHIIREFYWVFSESGNKYLTKRIFDQDFVKVSANIYLKGLSNCEDFDIIYHDYRT